MIVRNVIRGERQRFVYRIGRGLLTAGLDYRDDIALPNDMTITHVRVTAFGNVTSDCIVQLRDAATGGGNGIAVTVLDEAHTGTASGSLAITTSDTLYIRFVSGNGFHEGELELWS